MATITRIVKEKTGLFEEVKVGDYFEYKDRLFIRVEGVDAYDGKLERGYVNAVCLSLKGVLTAFDNSEKVNLIDNDSVKIEYSLKQ
jgi:hypothetical protein